MKLFFRSQLIFFCCVFCVAATFADAPETNAVLKQIAPGIFQLGAVRLNAEKKTIHFPASINMTDGAVEYFLVNGIGKLHESVLKTETQPAQIHMAMLFLGAKGAPANSATNAVSDEKFITHVSTNKIQGDAISIEVSWKNGASEKRVHAEDLIFNTQKNTPMSRGDWIYNGSKVVNGTFIAQRDGSIISIITDDLALVNNPRPGHENDTIWNLNTNTIPPKNTSVEVTFKLESPRTNAQNTK